MSADFWAGYISGALGILIGNPLDLLKTRLQASGKNPISFSPPTPGQQPVSDKSVRHWSNLARGAAAPILGYGALNAILFVTYNRSLALLSNGSTERWAENPSGWSIWAAGAVGGLATFVVSAPTELVKCRAQVALPPRSSLEVTKDLWRNGGLRGLYLGGGVTSIRDAVGYGFYFWSYELAKRSIQRPDDSHNQQAVKVLLCGGLAGVVTWASIFPLDVIKTRVQTWDLLHQSTGGSSQPLLQQEGTITRTRPSSLQIAKTAYQAEGVSILFRGLGVCSARAFIVNAVQWAVYEWTMKLLAR